MSNIKTAESPAGRYDIEVSNQQTAMRAALRTLPRTARRVLRHFGVAGANLSIVVVDTPTIRKLKMRYFGRSQDTDVISFDLRDTQDPHGAVLDAEVVINAQRAQALTTTAREAAAELHLYLVHGLLHQLGFDDDTAASARRMHQQEDELLERLGWGRPYHRPPGRIPRARAMAPQRRKGRSL